MSNAVPPPNRRAADATPEQFSPDRLRELLHRKTMAGERHRAHVARLMRMTDTEAAALAHLAQHGQLTPGQLGNLLGLSSGGTTALLGRLLDAGHLVTYPHPRDKRSSLVTASRGVLEQAEQLYAPLVHEMNELAAELTEADHAVIGRYLTRGAELSEHRAARLDDVLREDERDVIAQPTPGLWA